MGGYRYRDLMDAWKERNASNELLKGVQFALCGLGDSSYTTFFQNPTTIDEVMQQVGVACSPADAAPEIKAISDYVSLKVGGRGCVRDVIEKVMNFMEEKEVDSLYGDLTYVSKEDTSKVIRYWKSGDCSRKEMEKGWMPPHPSFFLKKSITSISSLGSLGLILFSLGLLWFILGTGTCSFVVSLLFNCSPTVVPKMGILTLLPL